MKYLLIAFVISILGFFIITRNTASAAGQDIGYINPENASESLEAWLRRFDEKKIRMRDQLNKGASEDALVAFEKHVNVNLPDDVKAFYRLANGQKSPFFEIEGKGGMNYPFSISKDENVGNLFGSYEFLSLDEAQAEWENWKVILEQSTKAEIDDFNDHVDIRGKDPVRKEYANLKWIPFAKDGGGNSYAIDVAPTEGGKIGQIIVIGPDEDLRRVIATGMKELIDANSRQPIGEGATDKQRYFFCLVDG